MAGKTILLVEDNVTMRGVLEFIVTSGGYKVVGEASNGFDAVTKFEQLRPDLCIVDIKMPGMDGIETTKAIKEIDSSALIVICSSNAEQHLVYESMQAGAIDFIRKPFSEKGILETVEKVLGC